MGNTTDTNNDADAAKEISVSILFGGIGKAGDDGRSVAKKRFSMRSRPPEI